MCLALNRTGIYLPIAMTALKQPQTPNSKLQTLSRCRKSWMTTANRSMGITSSYYLLSFKYTVPFAIL